MCTHRTTRLLIKISSYHRQQLLLSERINYFRFWDSTVDLRCLNRLKTSSSSNMWSFPKQHTFRAFWITRWSYSSNIMQAYFSLRTLSSSSLPLISKYLDNIQLSHFNHSWIFISHLQKTQWECMNKSIQLSLYLGSHPFLRSATRIFQLLMKSQSLNSF